MTDTKKERIYLWLSEVLTPFEIAMLQQMDDRQEEILVKKLVKKYKEDHARTK